MAKSDRGKLLEAIAVTAELTGSEYSEGAVRVFIAQLEAYPLDQVMGALARCQRELKGRLTVASVIERLDDGRPGAEEAWAMIPRDEQGSVVWTEEMAAAFGICADLLYRRDVVAARMAFKEAYEQAVARNRDAAIPVKWTPSLGRDPSLRAAALELAVAKHRMLPHHAAALLPAPDAAPELVALAAAMPMALSVRGQP
jgi:hypothetical protein